MEDDCDDEGSFINEYGIVNAFKEAGHKASRTMLKRFSKSLLRCCDVIESSDGRLGVRRASQSVRLLLLTSELHDELSRLDDRNRRRLMREIEQSYADHEISRKKGRKALARCVPIIHDVTFASLHLIDRANEEVCFGKKRGDKAIRRLCRDTWKEWRRATKCSSLKGKKLQSKKLAEQVDAAHPLFAEVLQQVVRDLHPLTVQDLIRYTITGRSPKKRDARA